MNQIWQLNAWHLVFTQSLGCKGYDCSISAIAICSTYSLSLGHTLALFHTCCSLQQSTHDPAVLSILAYPLKLRLQVNVWLLVFLQ